MGAQHLQPPPAYPMVLGRSARVLLNHLCPARSLGPTLQWSATSGEDQSPRQSLPSIRRESLRWWMTSSGIALQDPATRLQHRCSTPGTVSTRRPSTLLQPRHRYYRSLSAASSSSVPSSCERGYRSFDSYMSANKAEHIKASLGWTQHHAHTARLVSRSVARGIGPNAHSAGYSGGPADC